MQVLMRWAVRMRLLLIGVAALGSAGALGLPLAGKPAPGDGVLVQRTVEPDAPASPAPAQEPSPTPAPATPSPTPSPTPVPFLDEHRVVAYYGNPLTSLMGILGEHSPEEVIRRLRAQAAAYQELSPDRTVVGAVDLVYAVAQADAGRDGLYLLRMSDELIREWIEITRREGLLLFLDIQFGRSNVEREIPLVLPYLLEPHVHLALDPEFAWGPDQFPLQHIGHLDGADINRAQEIVRAFQQEHHLPEKLIVVHQFRHDMITNKGAITRFERMDVIINADGFGPPSTKLGSWNAVIRDDGVQRAGIKLFYRQDAASERLMTELEVMRLEPAPVFIVYQ